MAHLAEAQTNETRLLEALRRGGLRLTVQRRAICHYLAHTDAHPTAHQIYTDLKAIYPSLSLATVYNTLEALVALGAIHALGDAGDNAVHYDADATPHVNLACVRCHRIVDLPSAQLAALEEEARRVTGYRLLGARIMYYGLCPDCQRELAEQGDDVSRRLSGRGLEPHLAPEKGGHDR